MVFGSVTTTSELEGYYKDLFFSDTKYKMWFPQAELNIVDTNTSRVLFNYKIMKGKNYFYWHLPLGNYVFNELIITGTSIGATHWQKWRIYGEYTVNSNISTIYIGNLKIEQTGEKMWFDVEDNYEDAVKNLKSKYPNLSENVTKNLLKLEKRR